MQAYRVETTIQQDGALVVRDLPLQAGETVEVIILVHSSQAMITKPYSLRGFPVVYRDPTDPVADADWEAAP